MTVGFPPQPLYPQAIDSDYTLFLVYNTAEARLAADNAAWAEEIEIYPVGPDEPEIWADNGFGNLEGELFYYDAVAKNEHGKVYKFLRCARNLGGQTRFQEASVPPNAPGCPCKRRGTWVRGLVVAEHHNQLVDCTIATERFILLVDSCAQDLVDEPPCPDDVPCPDVDFDFQQLTESDPCEGTTYAYSVNITGTYNSFLLDFGDGQQTNTLSGQHTYPPNTQIDPIARVDSDNCTIAQTPTNRTSDRPVAPTLVDPPNWLIPVPEVPTVGVPSIPIIGVDPEIPPIIIPSIVIPGLSIPDFDIQIPSIITVIDDIPSIIIVIDDIPSIIEIVPSTIDVNVDVDVNIPTIITVIDDIPNPITVIDDLPDSISIIGGNITSVINIEGGDITSTITIEGAEDIPTKITLEDNLPSEIPIRCDCEIPDTIEIICPSCQLPSTIEIIGVVPSEISIICTIPSEISIISSIPSEISIISTIPDEISIIGTLPSEISVIGTLPSTISVIGTLPSTISVISTIPSVISIISTIPDEIRMSWGTPPEVTVNWGEAPVITCDCTIDVNVNCASCPPCPTVTPTVIPSVSPSVTPSLMATPLRHSPLVAEVVKKLGFGEPIDIRTPMPAPEPEPAQAFDLGIPSEIVMIAPEIPNVKVVHDLPAAIALDVPSIPDVKLTWEEEPIPNEIKVVNETDLPKTISLVTNGVPEAIMIDASAIPTALRLEPIENFPSKIELDASDMPTEVKVTGFPDAIEVKIPSEIVAKLEVPENLEIPLVYKSGPIPIEFPKDNVPGMDTDAPCFHIIPCNHSQ